MKRITDSSSHSLEDIVSPASVYDHELTPSDAQRIEASKKGSTNTPAFAS